MSTEFVDRTTDIPLGQMVSPQFPYLGLPTTCDGAEAVVWVETQISQASGAYPHHQLYDHGWWIQPSGDERSD